MEDINLQRLYDWLMDDNREPAQTKFTAGLLRNVAREVEHRLKLKQESTPIVTDEDIEDQINKDSENWGDSSYSRGFYDCIQWMRSRLQGSGEKNE